MNLFTDNFTAIETSILAQSYSRIIDFHEISELDDSLGNTPNIEFEIEEYLTDASEEEHQPETMLIGQDRYYWDVDSEEWKPESCILPPLTEEERKRLGGQVIR